MALMKKAQNRHQARRRKRAAVLQAEKLAGLKTGVAIVSELGATAGPAIAPAMTLSLPLKLVDRSFRGLANALSERSA